MLRVWATRKLRKFTQTKRTNTQARNHENSDEFRAQPVRHLDLATPAFYHYRKNQVLPHSLGNEQTNGSARLGLPIPWIYSLRFALLGGWGKKNMNKTFQVRWLVKTGDLPW